MANITYVYVMQRPHKETCKPVLQRSPKMDSQHVRLDLSANFFTQKCKRKSLGKKIKFVETLSLKTTCS